MMTNADLNKEEFKNEQKNEAKQVIREVKMVKGETEKEQHECVSEEESFTGWDKIKIDDDWKKEVKSKIGSKGKKCVI